MNLARALSLSGIIAAFVLFVVGNVLSMRHYRRFDVTKSQRYTLSQPTRETLQSLAEPIDIYVLLPAGDPVESSLKQTLVSYRAVTSQLNVRWIDPDRDPVGFVDVQRRFQIEFDRTEDGRVAADAIVVVVKGDRRWFITRQELFDAGSGADVRVKPREERALTGAIRAVLAGHRAKLCFTTGHGELAIDPTSSPWIGDLRRVLEKDNYDLASVETALPGAFEPFAGCAAVVIAGVRAPFSKEEANRLRTYLLSGGAALISVGPVDAATESGLTDPGLSPALLPFGIGLEEALVVEKDPSLVLAQSLGIAFAASAKAHETTRALRDDDDPKRAPKALVFVARPLVRVSQDAAAVPVDLLVSSAAAIAVRSIRGAAEWREPPSRGPLDLTGPFVLAMASERKKTSETAPHPPRVVVLGSSLSLSEEHWKRERPLRGGAMLVGAALSWLTSRPLLLDVPDKPEVTAGIRITSASRTEVRNYVLIYMPLAVALLGIAIGFRRKSTDGTGRPHAPPKEAEAPMGGSRDKKPSRRSKREDGAP